MKTKFIGLLKKIESDNILPSSLLTIITALIVGIGSGFGAVLFRKLIDLVEDFSFEYIPTLLNNIEPYHIILLPAVGGLIVGPLIYFFAREAKGHGVPEVMEAVSLHGGRIRPQVALVKSLASSICIGTGGSVGREGPIAQIGSALGSTIGQLLKLPVERIRSLVACGAAGGIAATFNAPIAGSMFALEVILGKFHVVSFGAVVISAVSADVVAQIFEGNTRAFIIPDYSFSNPKELILYSILGIIAAIFAFSFTKLLYFSEDLWDKFNIPEYVKPVIGGLLLGAVGFFTYKLDGFPRIFSVGYDSITQALNGQLIFNITIVLLLLKFLSTSLTLGSGGSGGIFAPSLFMGAMLGSSFGSFCKTIFPNLTSSHGAYALVGMSAFFSGAAQAPITSILIMFEMTRNYRIILPLMFATVLSTFVSRIISKESIYTLKLSRRGIHLEQGQDIDIMKGILVEEIMIRNTPTVKMDMPLPELSKLFIVTHKHGYPVVNNNNKLTGMVTISDLDKEQLNENFDDLKVADIATTSKLIYLLSTDSMAKAIDTISRYHLSHLPVIDSNDTKHLKGLIHISDIVEAYNHAISKKAQLQLKSEALRLGKLDNVSILDFTIPENSNAVNRRISEINLPSHCLILSLRRGKKVHIPDGFTQLKAFDQLTIISDDEFSKEVEQILSNHSDETIFESYAQKSIKISIPEGSQFGNMRIRHLSLPEDIIIVSIQRDKEILVPHGNTIIKTSDVLKVFGNPETIDELKRKVNKIQ